MPPQEYGRKFTYMRFRVLTGLWLETLLLSLDGSAEWVADSVWNCDVLLDSHYDYESRW